MIGKLNAGKDDTTVIVNIDTPRRSKEEISYYIAELDKLINLIGNLLVSILVKKIVKNYTKGVLVHMATVHSK